MDSGVAFVKEQARGKRRLEDHDYGESGRRDAISAGLDMSLQISPLSRSFGAEVLNADISGSLGKGVREEIWRALLRHKLLVFRQQALAPSDIVKIGRAHV